MTIFLVILTLFIFCDLKNHDCNFVFLAIATLNLRIVTISCNSGFISFNCEYISQLQLFSVILALYLTTIYILLFITIYILYGYKTHNYGVISCNCDFKSPNCDFISHNYNFNSYNCGLISSNCAFKSKSTLNLTLVSFYHHIFSLWGGICLYSTFLVLLCNDS